MVLLGGILYTVYHLFLTLASDGLFKEKKTEPFLGSPWLGDTVGRGHLCPV